MQVPLTLVPNLEYDAPAACEVVWDRHLTELIAHIFLWAVALQRVRNIIFHDSMGVGAAENLRSQDTAVG